MSIWGVQHSANYGTSWKLVCPLRIVCPLHFVPMSNLIHKFCRTSAMNEPMISAESLLLQLSADMIGSLISYLLVDLLLVLWWTSQNADAFEPAQKRSHLSFHSYQKYRSFYGVVLVCPLHPIIRKISRLQLIITYCYAKDINKVVTQRSSSVINVLRVRTSRQSAGDYLAKKTTKEEGHWNVLNGTNQFWTGTI